METKKNLLDCNTLIILGGGGHAKVVIDIAKALKRDLEIVILDDDLTKKSLYGYSIAGPIESFKSYLNDSSYFFVAIGNNGVRAKLLEQLREAKKQIATLIAPFSFISESADIGAGTVIMPGVVVNADSIIGEGCIVNTGATVDHDCDVGKYSHLAPGSNLAGGVKIGESVLVGVGSQVIPCVEVGDKCIVGAGSTVISNVFSGTTVVGSPAKPIVST